MKRAYYIDLLRIFLTVLVFFHHSAIAFGGSGGWYYVSQTPTSGATQYVLSLFMSIDQSYFMSLFFFISALFMPISYDKKGFARFLKERLVRLGIPLLVYTALIHPTLVYWIHLYLDKTDASWVSFVWMMDTHHAEPGPMWFVLTLLFIETVYALYRRFFAGTLSKLLPDKLPSTAGIFLFMIVTGLLAYLIRMVCPVGTSFFGLQFGFFSLYIGMYFVGILACRRNWMEQLTLKGAIPWFSLSLICIPMLMIATRTENVTPFLGGLNLSALFYAMWEPVMCVGISYFLLAFSKKYFNRPNKFILILSGDSYTAYIIHPMVVVCCTFLVEQLSISPLEKLALLLVIGIPCCFAMSHLLRLIPGMKKVF